MSSIRAGSLRVNPSWWVRRGIFARHLGAGSATAALPRDRPVGGSATGRAPSLGLGEDRRWGGQGTEEADNRLPAASSVGWGGTESIPAAGISSPTGWAASATEVTVKPRIGADQGQRVGGGSTFRDGPGDRGGCRGAGGRRHEKGGCGGFGYAVHWVLEFLGARKDAKTQRR